MNLRFVMFKDLANASLCHYTSQNFQIISLLTLHPRYYMACSIHDTTREYATPLMSPLWGIKLNLRLFVILTTILKKNVGWVQWYTFALIDETWIRFCCFESYCKKKYNLSDPQTGNRSLSHKRWNDFLYTCLLKMFNMYFNRWVW